jgi:hypothetical protein
MAAVDVPNDGSGLRTGVTQETLDRAFREAEQQHEKLTTELICAGIALGAMMLIGLFYLVRHRRALLARADSAVIGGLAAGVTVGRAARVKKASFVARVLAKADEKSKH